MSAIRVLIVDDSVTMRAMLEQVVSADAGCDVVGVAADVEHAKILMDACRPNVMTLDLTMPGINGMQFLQDLADQRHPPIIVVSSTSKHGAVETERALQSGAVACVDKSMLLADVPGFLRLLKDAASRKLAANQHRAARLEPVCTASPTRK